MVPVIYPIYIDCFTRSRREPAKKKKKITDADYADDVAILANTPNQAKTLRHVLERAVAGIGLHVNAHKTEYMCYNQTGDITTLNGTIGRSVERERVRDIRASGTT